MMSDDACVLAMVEVSATLERVETTHLVAATVVRTSTSTLHS